MSGTITSIPANDRLERYVATAGQTLFPYDFPVFAAADLRVTRLRGTAATVLALGTDYTVSGAGQQAGGSITLTAGALAGDILAIESAMPVGRQAQLQNGGDLPAAVIEGDFNRLYIALQQQQLALARAMVQPATDAPGLVLPARAQRANRYLAFDADGNPTPQALALGGTTVTTFATTLLDDATAADACATLGAVARGGDTMTGNLAISKVQPTISLNAPTAGSSMLLASARAGSTRWALRLGADDAESGGNAGSTFDLLRYTDAGAFIDAPLAISRATGVATFLQRPTHSGAQLAVQPQSASGVGQWVSLISGPDQGVSLPAGGTWAFVTFRLNNISGGVLNGGGQVGIAAGGTNVGVAITGHQYTGFAWRIA